MLRKFQGISITYFSRYYEHATDLPVCQFFKSSLIIPKFVRVRKQYMYATKHSIPSLHLVLHVTLILPKDCNSIILELNASVLD